MIDQQASIFEANAGEDQPPHELLNTPDQPYLLDKLLHSPLVNFLENILDINENEKETTPKSNEEEIQVENLTHSRKN